MEYATWEKHKKELANETWTAWAKWPKDVQDAMRQVDPEYREFLRHDAAWQNAQGTPFLPGNAYRVNPLWPGPAKPVPEYEDCKVHISGDRSIYTYAYSSGSCSHVRSIECAIVNPRFAGYVMPDGKLRPRLLFDLQKDGTYRLRVPLAVRLRKEVVG
jgi:hypothetical protein